MQADLSVVNATCYTVQAFFKLRLWGLSVHLDLFWSVCVSVSCGSFGGLFLNGDKMVLVFMNV